MNSLFLKTFALSLSIGMMTQFSHAATISSSKVQNNKTTVLNAQSLEKTSLIEKALIQQKRANKQPAVASADELKVLNAIRVAPTQNFFAAQHEHFSRFVQSLFESHES